MTAGRVHIVGAGLAGLSAAVRLAVRGHRVVVYEAAPHAGGRCRSYFDAELGCRTDNGNHLVLAANTAALQYLDAIGAARSMIGPKEPRLDFCDLSDGARWVLAPNRGRLPWWILASGRRVPGTQALDYLRVARLRHATADDTIAACLDSKSRLFCCMWQPFAVAVLNTEVEAGSAALLWQMLVESFGAGGAALRPLVPCQGLSESFVDPALSLLSVQAGEVRFGVRLRGLDLQGEAVSALLFDDGQIAVGPQDSVILAVPAPVAGRIVPGVTVPTEFRAIVNAHYRVDASEDLPLVLGLIGGTAEWIFRKPGIVSVTVSAADRLLDRPAEALAAELWRDVARAYRWRDAAPPTWRIVKEKRATFAATPAQLRLRPEARTRWRNLVLAGDWTRTGMPSTIEGAVRSGHTAARLVHDLPQPGASGKG
jgi:squalene-associated FAD-dependent desaturase